MTKYITLTEELIEKGKSQNGGWSLNQLGIFGIGEFKKGWKKEIIGKKITEKQLEEFLLLRNEHLQPKNEKTYTDHLMLNPDFPNSEQYKNPKWKEVRERVLRRDKNECQKCGKINSELHVHHLKYEKEKFIWEIDLKFLLTLCKMCHEEIHNRKI